METAHEPIDAEATLIGQRAKNGSHRHFEVTDDVDAEGYRVAQTSPR